MALHLLGVVAHQRGAYLKARECHSESRALFQEMGRHGQAAEQLSFLGDAALAMGEYAEAERCLRETLAVFKDLGKYASTAGSMVILGDVAVARGDYSAARERYRQALEVTLDHRPVGGQLRVLVGMSKLLARERGDPVSVERAVELVSLALRHFSGYRLLQRAIHKAQRCLDELRSELSPDAFAAAQARGRALDLDATVAELSAELGPVVGGSKG